MKFFYKLFLSMVLILTVALAAVEYFTVAYSLERSFQRERDSQLSQHQLVKYSIQASILNAVEHEALTRETLADIGREAGELVEDAGALELIDRNAGENLYSNRITSQPLGEVEEGYVRYQMEETEAGEIYLLVTSRFTQSGEELQLVTERRITQLFDEAEHLWVRCVQIYVVVLGVGGLMTLLLSWLLTRPLGTLQRVSRSFAEGDYTQRVSVRSHDEVGELAESYNAMAATIEKKIQELEDAARRQEDFTANFAHELKTPMTSIIGYADTLYQKELSPEEVHQAAGTILNEGMRLEALSFKLLELVTLNRSDFTLEEMEISGILEDVRETILPAAEKRGVTLTVSCQPGWVRLEYDLFKTLVLNLLDNALKSGGSHVALEGQAVGGEYILSVTDDGRGIPADELSRITEAFYMIDKSRSRREHGAGLGLALCARIAQIHNTRLEYESELYEGTRVQLPLKLEENDCE